MVDRYGVETVVYVYIAIVPEEQVGAHILGIRYASIPYCDPIKGKIERSTSLSRGQRALPVVVNTTTTIPLRGIGENNIRVGIIHDDRFFGYIRGVWPGPEKIEALPRRILYPESRKLVGSQFLGQSGVRGGTYSR